MMIGLRPDPRRVLRDRLNAATGADWLVQEAVEGVIQSYCIYWSRSLTPMEALAVAKALPDRCDIDEAHALISLFACSLRPFASPLGAAT